MTLDIAKTTLYVALSAGQPGTLLVQKTNLYAAESTEPPIYPPDVIRPSFFDGSVSEVFAVAAVQNLGGVTDAGKFTIQEMERNPYRAHLPSDPAEMQADLHEQQRVLRQQHNITQAGDSTFDFGLLLRSYPNREFTLGSLGRFFHEDYGIIQARFVKFKDFVDHPYQGQPVGRLDYAGDSVDWVVTNDYTKSDKDLIFGFTFLAETPPDDYYGWAVVSGCNPASIRVGSQTVPQQNDSYTWTETGTLEIAANGRIAGRRWGNAFRPGLSAGALFVTLEGPSIVDLIDLIDQETAETVTALAALEGRVTTIEGTVSDHSSQLLLLGATDVTLLARIQREEEARRDQIQAVLTSIPATFDWQEVIDNIALEIRGEFAAADDTLTFSIAGLETRVSALETLVGGMDIAGIQAQLLGINSAIAALSTGLSGFAFDFSGGITADQTLISTLVTNSDGNDEAVFVPVDFKLQELKDVDVTLLAGDKSPVWDGVDSFIFLKLARASNLLDAASPLIITAGGTVGDPITTFAHDVSGATAGSYGSATLIPVIDVDVYGHITGISTVAASGGSSYTDETARDAIAAMIVDSTTIDFTNNDGADTATLDVIQTAIKPTTAIIIHCSNETTHVTTGTDKRRFRMPFAFTVTEVRASVNIAPTGANMIFDINEGGVSILSTKLSIDATEKTSTTAATAPVISDSALADDAEIGIDFDQVGSTLAGAGVKITLIGHRA